MRSTSSLFWLVLTTAILVIACRTADVIAGVSSRQSTPTAAAEQTPRPQVRVPTRAAPEAEPTEIAAVVVTAEPTEVALEPPPEPTEEPPQPTIPPRPTQPPTVFTRAPTKRPAPTEIPTITPTPAPTRCPQQYCAVYRGCQPDSGNTVVEGMVYENGQPKNGVAVRVSVAEGAYPIVEGDFVSGNDPINPNMPDPANPGRYVLQIVAGAPREGNWWVFVVDQPNGTRQISEGIMIHTDADPFIPNACQRAFVDFVK